MSSQSYFDDIAGQWDDIRQNLFPDSVREKALAAAGVQSGQSAADIGAGSGFITAALVAAKLTVIAIDQSQKMLDVIAEKFGKDGKVDCRKGDADALPVGDQQVDYVFANMYLHHVETPPAAIKEMFRVLKPGGKLVITDMDEHTFEFLITEQHDRWMGFKREDIRQWFEAAGLKNVAVDCLNESCASDSTQQEDRAEVTIFIATGEK